MSIQAQVSSNPNKFLGNITTSYNVDAGGGVPAFYKLWNQITCENESKWASVEGTRGTFNWGCDNAFNYAKSHKFTYKVHALVWGAQYPNWLSSLSATERYAALTNWFDKAKEKYATLPLIDVVNEAVGNHQAGNPMMKETLGGGGKTGYDWLIKAFEMAYERWPDAILIYNDYNSIRWDLDNYITLVQTLRDAGAPIDAYGNQAHELKGISVTELKNALKKQQDALGMPMYVTEYDISSTDDNEQLKYYKEQIPVIWEAPYCAGVTLWGYVYGKTWTDDGKGYSGIYKNGAERKAMTWLKEYMATDAAKNASGPLPGGKKEASIYIRPFSLKTAKGDVVPIKVRARLATKEIEKVDLYVADELLATMTEEPYIAEYTTKKAGWITTKAVVTATDGSTYVRHGRLNVLNATTKREPYNEEVPTLPGTINAIEYDKGASGVTYNNATRSASTSTKDGQWMDYTVDVTEDGSYYVEMEVASTKNTGKFHLAEYAFDNLIYYTNYTDVPNTGGNDAFQTLRCSLSQPLTAGRHVLTLMVDKGGFFIKSMTFKLSPVIDVPGTLELEDYTQCSDGVNFVSGNGGTVLGNTSSGQWLDYSINVMQDGKYTYEAMVSSAGTGSKFTMVLTDVDGREKTLATVSVPRTGSLDTYEVKSGTIRNALKAGKQKLRITITGGSCNIDYVKLISSDDTGISVPVEETSRVGTYNLLGLPVGDDYRGIVVVNGKKVLKK